VNVRSRHRRPLTSQRRPMPCRHAGYLSDADRGQCGEQTVCPRHGQPDGVGCPRSTVPALGGADQLARGREEVAPRGPGELEPAPAAGSIRGEAPDHPLSRVPGSALLRTVAMGRGGVSSVAAPSAGASVLPATSAFLRASISTASCGADHPDHGKRSLAVAACASVEMSCHACCSPGPPPRIAVVPQKGRPHGPKIVSHP
jgi:hypothetical protein